MNDFNQEDDQLQKISLSIWKKLLNVILKNKASLIIMICFAVLLAGLDVVSLLINDYALTTFITNNDYSNLNAYIIVNVIYAIVFGLCVFGFLIQGGKIEANVSYDLRKQAFKTLQRLPFTYYDKTPQGWIMARMTSDARRLSQVISWGIIDAVWSVLLMIFTLTTLFFYSWQLALIVLASLPLMFGITAFFRKKVLNRYRLSRKYNSALTAKFSESFHGAKTTKTLVIEDTNLNEFKETAEKMESSSLKAAAISAVFSSVLLMACYLVVAFVMVGGTTLAKDQIILISTLFLFIRATISFFDPIQVLTQFISSLQQAQASAERILELIETKSEIEDRTDVVEKYGDWFNKKKENWEPLLGEIEFKDVTFYYNENEIILDNFNLKIQKGMKVALVGHTGSGKTTIVNLISRFYEPKQGFILIDGKDYKDRSISWLHDSLGYVLQSPQLFSTNILENIRYGKLDATDEEVINASKLIGLHTFVEKLEKQYLTEVGEGGNLLSLGQKQLISFARAILADPSILILDEATSSIDSEAEALIQNATKSLLQNRTSLIVAHRLSTIVDSDLIIMLEGGKIIEQGTHETLLASRGAYFDLYKNQFLQESENTYQKEMQKL